MYNINTRKDADPPLRTAPRLLDSNPREGGLVCLKNFGPTTILTLDDPMNLVI
jgi:hypothetical protein